MTGGAPIQYSIDLSEVEKAIDPRYSRKRAQIYQASKPVYTEDWFKPAKMRRKNGVFQAQSDPSTADNRAKVIDRERFEDPYDDEYKDRLINAALFDQVIQQTILTRIHYVLSRNMTPVFKPKRNIDNLSAQEAQQVLNDLVPVVTQEKANQYIWTLENEIIPFRKKIEGALFTAFVGGRSALLQEPMIDKNPFLTTDGQTFPPGTPGALKTLNYQHLGDIRVNTDSWEIEGVIYKDNIFEEDNFEFEMPREWLIYFTHMDVNMIPYSVGYGNSLLPPIMAISENNRRINEIVFPEIDESLWAGTGHWKVSDMAIFDQQEFVDSIAPARQLVYQKQDMEYQEIHLSYDMQGLINQRDTNTIMIMMQGRVPSMFLNRENITNRSTVEVTAEVWQETTLEGDRQWVRDTLHNDWYRPLLTLITGQNWFNLKMKVMLEFQKISFADIQAKATAIAQLLALPVPPIDEQEARMMLGLPPQRITIIAQAGVKEETAEEIMKKQMDKLDIVFDKANRNVDQEPKREEIPLANFIISRRTALSDKEAKRSAV